MTAMGFKVGDPVVYPAQGGGYIREIAEREVMGVVNTYYVIELIRKPGTIMVPVPPSWACGRRSRGKTARICSTPWVRPAT